MYMQHIVTYLQVCTELYVSVYMHNACIHGYAQVPLKEEVQAPAVAETCSSDPQVLHETKVLDLVTHNLLFKTI